MGFLQDLYLNVVERFAWPKLGKVCVAAITFDGEGENLGTWRIPITPGFYPSNIAEFIRGHEVLILQHWPRPGMLKRLREIAPKTRILGWVSAEVIQESVWTGQAPEATELHRALAGKLLPGTNGRLVDVYEGNPKGPSYAVNMLDPEIPQILANYLQISRAGTGLDGWMIDSMTPTSFYGTATNAPARQDRTPVWPEIIQGIRERDSGVEIWGNTVTGENPWGLDVALAEQFFVDRWDIEHASSALRARVCICVDRSGWGTAPERWKYLAHEGFLRGIGTVLVCTTWTGRWSFEPQWRW